MEGRIFLDICSRSECVHPPTACQEDGLLLVRLDAFLIPDLGLHAIEGARSLRLQRIRRIRDQALTCVIYPGALDSSSLRFPLAS